MINTEHQHQCSSKAIIHNASIRYALRQTYLIIDIEPAVDHQQQSYYSRLKDYIPYVSLNITDAANVTSNSSQTRTFMKRPNDDSSVSSILIGIGVVAVALFLLVIVIKLIRMCYKMWQEDDENKVDQTKKSPLIPSNVVRRNSSIRNPTAPIHRSSLNIETQMEIRRNRLSQTYSNTPPLIKKP